MFEASFISLRSRNVATMPYMAVLPFPALFPRTSATAARRVAQEKLQHPRLACRRVSQI